MYKLLYKLGFLGYLFLLILAIIFYKERTIFADIALHLFDIVVNGTFSIQAYRYGAVVTEVFPLVASKMDLSLSAVMISYSAGFIIYYALCYTLCGFVFKNYKLGLVLLLFNVLFVSDTFFWMQSEMPQGVAFMLCLFSYLSYKGVSEVKPLGLAFIFFAVITIVFFHTLMLLILLYVAVFLLLSKDNFVSRKWLYAVLVFALLVFLLKKYVFINAYEQSAMKNSDNLFKLLPDYFSLYSSKKFFSNCISKYYWLTPVFVSVLIFYAVKRLWWKLLFVFISATGYLLLVNVSYWYEAVQQFYIENLYLPLGVIVGLPFVADVLSVFEKRKLMAAGLLSAIIITCGIRITSTSGTYVSRLNWEREFLAEHSNEKLLIPHWYAPLDRVLVIWGTPYEFWLLSTVETGKTASITFSENMDPIIWAVNNGKLFITTYNVHPYADLPPKYFRLNDSSSVYKVFK